MLNHKICTIIYVAPSSLKTKLRAPQSEVCPYKRVDQSQSQYTFQWSTD